MGNSKYDGGEDDDENELLLGEKAGHTECVGLGDIQVLGFLWQGSTPKLFVP